MIHSVEHPEADDLLLGRTFGGMLSTGEKDVSENGRVAALRSVDNKSFLSFSGDGSLMTFAPTGSDKSGAVIVPNLRHYSGSIVVVDPQGEYYKATAEARRKMGHTVLRLDPFGVVDEHTDSLNPFDLIEPGGPTADSDCQEVARLLWRQFLPSDYIENAAFGLLSGVIGYLMAVPDKRKFQDLIPTFNSDDVVYNLAVVLDTIGKKIPAMAYQEISTFLQGADQERSKTLLQITSRLKPFMSKEVLNTLGSSSISLAEVVNGVPVSVYLIIPPAKLKSYAALLRVWTGTLLQCILRRRMPSFQRMLLMLDECAQFDTWPLLESVVALCRGQGLQIWTFWQDLSQLRCLYPLSWSTVVGQSDVVQVFGRKDYAAAAELEAVLGIEVEDVCLLASDEQILCLKDGQHKAKKWSGIFH